MAFTKLPIVTIIYHLKKKSPLKLQKCNHLLVYGSIIFFSLRLSKASRRQKWRLHDSLTLQIYQLKAFLAQSLYAARIYPQFYIQLLYKVNLFYTQIENLRI